jgi:hypothetical protein
LLQLFLAVICLTGLILAAVVAERESAKNALVVEQELLAERKRVERRLAAQYEVTRILSEAKTIAGAAPYILAAIGQSFDWELGALWNLGGRPLLQPEVIGGNAEP